MLFLGNLGLNTKICPYIFIQYFNWKNLYIWELCGSIFSHVHKEDKHLAQGERKKYAYRKEQISDPIGLEKERNGLDF